MSAGAIVMLIVGIVGLWGGLGVAIWHYVRRARADTGADPESPRNERAE